MKFLIGTYTDQTGSAGIYTLKEGLDGALTVAAHGTIWLRNPSYLIEHPSLPLVYAVSEIGEAPGGQVAVLRRDDQGDYVLWQVIASGGLDPCHLSLSPNGRTLLISHYSSGSVSVQGLTQPFPRRVIHAKGLRDQALSVISLIAVRNAATSLTVL